MAIESYLIHAPSLGSSSHAVDPQAQSSDTSLEDLIGAKSSLQAKKLEILAAELRWRLHVAAQNLHTLHQDQCVVEEMLNQLTVAADYRLRAHQEKAPLYRRMFEIETEKRSQRVECWRDIAHVMRDFLATWEAHEQARSRAIFFNDVGAGTQEPL